MSGADVQTGFPEITEGLTLENPRCGWNESVCQDSATHRIQYCRAQEEEEGPDAGGEVRLFCTRHYVLTLARLLEVHEMECGIPAVEHMDGYGPLSDIG